MNKIFKPGFELIFSVALIAILGLPPLVLAQTQKSIEIQIVNGDTTVNGKDIKKLSPAERSNALAEINNLPQTPIPPAASGPVNATITIKKRINSGNNHDVIIERSTTRNDLPQIAGLDSSKKEVKIHLRKLKGADSVQAFTYRFDNDLPPMDLKTFSFDMPKHKQIIAPAGRNTQNFNYTNTDNDGISTNISFNVSDASKEKAMRIAGTDKAELAINNLNLLPEFSTGKTVLSFNLPAKTPAEAKFYDTKGTILWADKVVAGSFSKKTILPINGVYYLLIKQGAATSVKKIVKE
ncbi:T9SS type A sorting domain-containing protein [Mucilaginibacter phyllosphaerae]|uniref:T9SS type A sorting domain-containing protein n=1 Tax=Mucilaginibacter phyllosphaerae TaxID=1812349 RepID=A0A4Y8ABM6_9SPHI|nr:T9SS type A sorting domain-containing protein [Mucilaginibacter phyllosphaerae]MBB3969963.1 hypothetical protein [Mucilaginibacter phyllosphaerae]TEW65332.1 T9SS type A sorting domain-containing protein [Mucilaginibacter phyllosphaerae]GGH16537.1 hypothetical protein GCM10007352_26010 [Mucilaginibacter phyllosphaerae]